MNKNYIKPKKMSDDHDFKHETMNRIARRIFNHYPKIIGVAYFFAAIGSFFVEKHIFMGIVDLFIMLFFLQTKIEIN